MAKTPILCTTDFPLNTWSSPPANWIKAIWGLKWGWQISRITGLDGNKADI